jgi:septal ring factor EnvC (AmiA/AmiB activator)
MFASWIIYTVLISLIVYLLVLLKYKESIYKKEKKVTKEQEKSIKDAKLLINKYRIQLQRSIGNTDILTENLNTAKNELKTLRSKNSQQKIENDHLQRKIKMLDEKIEALV